MKYLPTQRAKDLPQVKELSFFSKTDWIADVKNVNSFSNVKQLELVSDVYAPFDILRMISILRACPLLEKFYLAVRKPVYHKEGIDNMSTESVHKHLKEVTFATFPFKANYIEFAMYLLENAGTLEQMIIGPTEEYLVTIESMSISWKGWNLGTSENL